MGYDHYPNLDRAFVLPDRVQDLLSEINRAIDVEKDAKPLFEYLEITGSNGQVKIDVASTWTDSEDSEPFTLALSEFVQPGAVAWFNGEDAGDIVGWRIDGPGRITTLQRALVSDDGFIHRLVD